MFVWSVSINACEYIRKRLCLEVCVLVSMYACGRVDKLVVVSINACERVHVSVCACGG
jgi:hypothetical protein